jgi:predicted MFS family arabinose efflux permease
VDAPAAGAGDRRRLFAAALLRTAGVGMTGTLLGLHLGRSGVAPAEVGTVVAWGLAGGTAGTALVAAYADRWGRRRTLCLLALLGGAGALVVAFASGVAWLAAGAFVGMVNGMGRDRGPAFTLEQAVLPQTTTPERRTAVYAAYAALLDVGHLAGALLAAAPAGLRALGVEEAASYRVALASVALLGLAGAALLARLSPGVERAGDAPPRRLSPAARPFVLRFAALSALDSFGGGFLPNTLITMWFHQRFGVDEAFVGPLFAVGRVANMASYALAVRLARRWGLLRTMVFTHVPASLLLMTLPFAPSLLVAAAVYLVRELLLEMDLPTRQSYLAAVVPAGDRTAATGAVNLTRLSAWSLGAMCSGAAFAAATSAPLFVAGGLKIAYDLAMYAAFRRVRPPEERGAS